MKPEDQLLTAFVCDLGFYEWTRIPFRMRSSGCTFIRAIRRIIEPIRDFAESYVDDMAVHSLTWNEHLKHVDQHVSQVVWAYA